MVTQEKIVKVLEAEGVTRFAGVFYFSDEKGDERFSSVTHKVDVIGTMGIGSLLDKLGQVQLNNMLIKTPEAVPDTSPSNI